MTRDVDFLIHIKFHPENATLTIPSKNLRHRSGLKSCFIVTSKIRLIAYLNHKITNYCRSKAVKNLVTQPFFL